MGVAGLGLSLLAGSAGISAGTAISQGAAQRKAAHQAERNQLKAQEEARNAAQAEQRSQARERRRLNRRQPDVLSLLSRERLSATGGVGATLLTRGSGVSRGNLGRSGSLGG